MSQRVTSEEAEASVSLARGDGSRPQRASSKVTGPATAVITGASSGIGAAFALHLAARGHDALLIGRREDRLTALATALYEHYGVAAEPLAADLADTGDVDRVLERLRRLHAPSFLVNNAGFGTVGSFVEVDVQQHVAMIETHVLASVRLTHAILPTMVARREGAIVNVASIGAFLPTPGNVTYGATKAYLLSFSRALAEELRASGVRVQALVPGFTRTAFYETPEYARFDSRQIPGALFMTTDEVVRASLRALATGRVVCVPGMQNRALIALAQMPMFTGLLLSRYRDLAQLRS